MRFFILFILIVKLYATDSMKLISTVDEMLASRKTYTAIVNQIDAYKK